MLVLNGNGVQGAASSTAARLQAAGYRIGAATNAQRHDYARSMVMYVPGWVKEARRLARDTGVSLVAPVDGVGPAQLKGSQVVFFQGTGAEAADSPSPSCAPGRAGRPDARTCRTGRTYTRC